MATRKKTASERVDELEQVLIDLWHEAQNCDGSRAQQLETLDNLQGLIENEIPDVADLEPSGDDDEEEEDDDE